jgi:hypothetical protein
VPAEKILYGPRENVMDSRAPIGCGWAFEKHELRLPFRLGERLLEEVLFFPESKDLLL